MILTSNDADMLVSLYNDNPPYDFVRPMTRGIAEIVLETLEKNQYEVHLDGDSLSILDKVDGEKQDIDLDSLIWKPRLIEQLDDNDMLNNSNSHCQNLLNAFFNKNLRPIEYEQAVKHELERYHRTKLFDEDGGLKWHSIDYTTRNWLQIDGQYYEKEASMLCLTVGQSFESLEEEYGENNFPEKAMNDGKIIFFSDEDELDLYLMERHDLLGHEAIRTYMEEYFQYNDAQLISMSNPSLKQEHVQFLVDIIEKQEMDIRSLPSVELSKLVNYLDMENLSQDERQKLEHILQDEHIAVQNINITKELFDTFFDNLREQAKKQITNDLENIKAKGLYAYNCSSDYHVILTQRENGKFCVHSVYNGSECGLEHGSYDITTLDNAEKSVMARLARNMGYEPASILCRYNVNDTTVGLDNRSLKDTVEVQRHQFDSFYANLSIEAQQSVKDSFRFCNNQQGVYAYHIHNEPSDYGVVGQTNDGRFVGWNFHKRKDGSIGIEKVTHLENNFEDVQGFILDYMIAPWVSNYSKYEIVDYIAGATEQEFYDLMKEDLKAAFNHYNEYFAGKDNKIEFVDLKAYQFGPANGTVKLLVEYKGNVREDDLFEMLKDQELTGSYSDTYSVNGVNIDVNPIKAEKSGTISQYLESLKVFEKETFDKERNTSKKQTVSPADDNAVNRFFKKVRKGLTENDVTIKQVLHAAAVALDGFSEEEKVIISSFISDKGAISGKKVGKVISDTLNINIEKKTSQKKWKDHGERER